MILLYCRLECFLPQLIAGGRLRSIAFRPKQACRICNFSLFVFTSLHYSSRVCQTVSLTIQSCSRAVVGIMFNYLQYSMKVFNQCIYRYWHIRIPAIVPGSLVGRSWPRTIRKSLVDLFNTHPIPGTNLPFKSGSHVQRFQFKALQQSKEENFQFAPPQCYFTYSGSSVPVFLFCHDQWPEFGSMGTGTVKIMPHLWTRVTYPLLLAEATVPVSKRVAACLGSALPEDSGFTGITGVVCVRLHLLARKFLVNIYSYCTVCFTKDVELCRHPLVRDLWCPNTPWKGLV